MTPEIANSNCPSCDTPHPAGDLFCELCGTALPPEAPELQDVSDLACPKCQAVSAGIDPEGFCCECGFRREQRGRDHVEIVISSALAGVTDRGLRHHRNEDYLVLKAVPGASILIVTDGVSSVRDPDLASAAAADSAALAFEKLLAQPIGPPEVRTAIDAAHLSVLSLAEPNFPPADGPATTIVAAVVQAQNIVIGWRGDSRAYWFDATGIHQLTEDHSWCTEVIQSGEMTPTAAYASPQSHAITHWLGADASDSVPTAMAEFPIPGPGKLLLCSDGLWNYAPAPEDLVALLQSLPDGDAVDTCRELVGFARAKGGNDNITVAVLKVGEGMHDEL